MYAYAKIQPIATMAKWTEGCASRQTNREYRRPHVVPLDQDPLLPQGRTEGAGQVRGRRRRGAGPRRRSCWYPVSSPRRRRARSFAISLSSSSGSPQPSLLISAISEQKLPPGTGWLGIFTRATGLGAQMPQSLPRHFSIPASPHTRTTARPTEKTDSHMFMWPGTRSLAPSSPGARHYTPSSNALCNPVPGYVMEM